VVINPYEKVFLAKFRLKAMQIGKKGKVVPVLN
jgi:hypothetical protein